MNLPQRAQVVLNVPTNQWVENAPPAPPRNSVGMTLGDWAIGRHEQDRGKQKKNIEHQKDKPGSVRVKKCI